MALTQISIRSAVMQDAESLVGLIHAAYEEYRGHLQPPSGAHAETLESIVTLLERENAFVAAVSPMDGASGVVAGCVFHCPREDSLYLHRLAVLPAWRRNGVARALVAEVEAVARGIGFDWVSLGVRIALPENRRLYEGLGFQVVAYLPHPGCDSPTYISMCKWVGPTPARPVQTESVAGESERESNI